MSNKIITRIIEALNSPNLLKTLTEDAKASDLLSVLLETYKRRASKLSESQILQQYKNDRFVSPSGISMVESVALDMLAFKLLPIDFQIIELSPVCPLGTCSGLAPVDQNNIVTTIRNTEVCSDATNVLALEAAMRRSRVKKENSVQTKLCTSHRLVRAQVFNGPVSFAHFRALILCTAGRTKGNFNLESDALIEQINYYLLLISKLCDTDYTIERIRVELLPFTEETLGISEKAISKAISGDCNKMEITISRDLKTENSYYNGLRFRIHVTNKSGNEYNIVDGGFTQWTQKLLNNRKEFFLTSGMGTERFISCFGNALKK